MRMRSKRQLRPATLRLMMLRLVTAAIAAPVPMDFTSGKDPALSATHATPAEH